MSDEDNKPAEEEKVDAPVAAEEKAPESAEKEAAPAASNEEAPKEEVKAEGSAEEAESKPAPKKDIFAEIMGEDPAEALKVHKAKKNKNISKGIVHVKATFNNTVVTVTDEVGNTIGWSSAGKMGFKGSRKSTAYAAQVVSQDACRQAMSHGLKSAEVRVKGPGAGRESAVRAIQTLGIDVGTIEDVTPIPHNGCRPKKARRV
ncbi:30S ribosomal protein S11 [Roseibacillus ishigakijimensis]|uniref:Small ribosomal subunit protein uS11 n=1 Tax=Roseibacillus ishigakijimensis TaxID=454146 RepID=A0A934RPG9_9BACT|nr:30S ribosomal protein S11 [Roseibacillus ishigakijimensis]